MKTESIVAITFGTLGFLVSCVTLYWTRARDTKLNERNVKSDDREAERGLREIQQDFINESSEFELTILDMQRKYGAIALQGLECGDPDISPVVMDRIRSLDNQMTLIRTYKDEALKEIPESTTEKDELRQRLEGIFIKLKQAPNAKLLRQECEAEIENFRQALLDSSSD